MFLVREQAEFELGKQHLANMMGMDPENMTQGILTQSDRPWDIESIQSTFSIKLPAISLLDM